MKKTLFLAILAGAALAGCVKNEEVAMSSGGSPERIKFDAPVVSVPTRATEIYGNYPIDKDFAVYALYHKGGFADGTFDLSTSSMYMTNVTCTHTPTTNTDKEPNEYWAPQIDYYWPKDGMLTFGAYAPAKTEASSANGKVWNNASVGWGKNGFTFTDFAVDDTEDNQIDLLYSDFVKDKTSSNVVTNKPYDGVTIPFKHALSSIVFKASSTDDGSGAVVKLTSIKVKNVAKKGTFVQIPGEGNNNWTINWADATAIKDVYEVYNDASGLTLTYEAQYVNGSIDETDDQYPAFDEDDPNNQYPADPSKKNDGMRRSDLILIPQALNGGDTGRGEGTSDATVEISYTITHTVEGKPVTETPTVEFKLAVKANAGGDPTYKWEMGKRYIYNIEIGMQKIHFNPQVLNWDDKDGFLEVK